MISVGVLEDSDLSDNFGTGYVEKIQIVPNKECFLPNRKITKDATRTFAEQANTVSWDEFEKEEDDQMYYQNVF